MKIQNDNVLLNFNLLYLRGKGTIPRGLEFCVRRRGKCCCWGVDKSGLWLYHWKFRRGASVYWRRRKSWRRHEPPQWLAPHCPTNHWQQQDKIIIHSIDQKQAQPLQHITPQRMYSTNQRRATDTKLENSITPTLSHFIDFCGGKNSALKRFGI